MFTPDANETSKHRLVSRGELAKLPAPTGKALVLETVRKAARGPRRPPAKPKADLAKSAGRIVERLGWAMAARVLPAPHYQLVKLTVSLGRGPVRESLGPDRSEAAGTMRSCWNSCGS